MEYFFNILYTFITEIKDIILNFWLTKKCARALGVKLNSETKNRFLFINLHSFNENLSLIVPTLEDHLNLSSIVSTIEFNDHSEDLDLDSIICDSIGIEDQSKHKLNVIKFEPDSEYSENKSYYGVSKKEPGCENIAEEPFYKVIKENSSSSDSSESFATVLLKKDDEMWMFDNEFVDCEEKFCAQDEEIEDMVSDTFTPTLHEDFKISQIEDGGNIKSLITSSLKVKLKRLGLTLISTSMINKKKEVNKSGRYNLRPRNCKLSHKEQNDRSEIFNGKVYRKDVNKVGYLMSEENKKWKKIVRVNGGNTLKSSVKDLGLNTSTGGLEKKKARKRKKGTKTVTKPKHLSIRTCSIPLNNMRSKIQAKKTNRKSRGLKANRKWRGVEILSPSEVKLVRNESPFKNIY